MPQLPADCLNEIFEYLEEDEITLRSCLLVNRLWCEVSVRILWRSIRNYNTLIACLPNESKEILYKDSIITPIATLKPPMFNYATFCKVLSVRNVDNGIIKQLFKNQQSTPSQSLNDNVHTVTQEVLKLLMSQASLREIILKSYPFYIPKLTSFPEAKDCLMNLSELRCDSEIYPEFFYQSSQICHNLQSLEISFGNVISDGHGLVSLISVQKNLEYLKITQKYCICKYSATDIITPLTKLPNTIIKLHIVGDECRIPLSFVAKLTNLQEIMLSFDYQDCFRDFKTLQYITFPQLQILKFQYISPSHELLIKFLENNGKNLKEFYVDRDENSLNLAIAEFCPNLRKLTINCESSELETLKKIFNNCQYLESTRIWCGIDYYFSKNELLEIVAEYSPKNFHELKIRYRNCNNLRLKLLPKELESFFIKWTNRIPQKSLSFTIICNGIDTLANNDENRQIIEKYIELGIIKEFKTTVIPLIVTPLGTKNKRCGYNEK